MTGVVLLLLYYGNIPLHANVTPLLYQIRIGSKEIAVGQDNDNGVQRHYNSIIIFATNKYKPKI